MFLQTSRDLISIKMFRCAHKLGKRILTGETIAVGIKHANERVNVEQSKKFNKGKFLYSVLKNV